jgi:hypothetical protein
MATLTDDALATAVVEVGMPVEERLRRRKIVKAQRVVDGACEGEISEGPLVQRFEGAAMKAIRALGVFGAKCGIPAGERVRSA